MFVIVTLSAAFFSSACLSIVSAWDVPWTQAEGPSAGDIPGKKDPKVDTTPLKGKDSSQSPAIKKAEDATEPTDMQKEAQYKLAAAQAHEDSMPVCR